MSLLFVWLVWFDFALLGLVWFGRLFVLVVGLLARLLACRLDRLFVCSSLPPSGSLSVVLPIVSRCPFDEFLFALPFSRYCRLVERFQT